MQRELRLSWLKRPRVLIPLVAAAGFVAGMLIFGQPWHLPPNYGDVPTWLAVVFAAVAGWVALDQLRILRDQVTREADDRRKAQASRVFVWTEQKADTTLSQAERASRGQQLLQTIVIAHIKNTSEQPVYDLMLSWQQGAALPGSVDSHGVLLPGAGVDLERHVAQNFNPSSPAAVTVTLGFRDAAQRRWVTDENGKLDQADI